MPAHPSSRIACVLLSTGLACAAPPLTIDLGATAPDAAGGHFGFSHYLGDNLFLQARLEEGVLRLDSRLAALHHGILGVGFEHEFTSKTYFRLTAGAGGGLIYNPGEKASDHSEWLYTARISPEVMWFPTGRYRRPSVGLNLGLNLQTRHSADHRPVMGGLSGKGLQIFAGLVL